MEPKRILIIRLSAIGDIIHTLPSLNALRQRFPEAYIGWVVEDFASDILQGHPQLDELFVIPKRKWRKPTLAIISREIFPFIKRLRDRKFDVAFDFQGLTKSSIIGYLSGAKMRVGFAGEDARELSSIFNNKKVVPPASARHVVKRNYSLLRALGINNFIPEAVIPIDDESVLYIDKFLAEANPNGKPLVAIQVTAGWETKQLPDDTFVELGLRIEKELGYRVIFLWGPGEENLIKRIVIAIKELGGSPIIAPPTTLRQLSALLKRCRLAIGGDTGPVHLAGALGVPVVSIFGGSDAARNSPYTSRQYILQKTEFPCVPCWKTRCPFKDRRYLQCLRSIKVDEIFRGVIALLNE